MKQTKNIYNFDDLLEVLAEHAIGTETMQEIEAFCEHKESFVKHLLRRLEIAERIIGSSLLDEHMLYE